MSILVGTARVSVTPDLSGFLGTLKTEVKTALAALNTEVPIRFTVDAASVAKAQAALGPLAAGRAVPLRFKVDPASAAAAKAAMGPLAGETVPIRFVVDSAGVATITAADKAVTGSATSAAAAQKTLNDTTRAGAAGAVAAGAAQRALAKDTGTTTAAANTANRAVTRLGRALGGRGITLFGGAFGTTGILASVGAIHLLADAVIETAAVVIPAGVALAAFGLAAVPAIQDLVRQWTNLDTVSEAFGKNLPPMIGGMDRLAEAVKPEVYALFGAGLSVVNSKIGVFESLAKGTGAALDQLAVRAQLAVAGQSATAFLSHAVADVAKLGDVVGNIFGIVGNLLKTMPGYAETLLNILDGVTHGLEVITGSGVAQGLIRAGLAFHGFALYAGLAVTGISLLAPLLARAGTWARGIQSSATATGQLAAGASRLDKTKAAFTDIGLAASGMQVKVIRAADGTAQLGREASTGANVLARWGGLLARFASPAGIATLAVLAVAAAVAFFVDKALTAQNATQKFVAGLQDSINAQTTFYGQIIAVSDAVTKSSVATRKAAVNYNDAAVASGRFGASQQQVGQAMVRFGSPLSTVSNGLHQFTGEQDLANFRMAVLTRQFGSLSKAQQIFNALGIKGINLATSTASAFGKADHAALDYLIAVKAVVQMSGLAAQGTGQYNAALNALNNTFLTGTLPNLQKVVAAQDNLTNVVLGGRQAFTIFQQAIQGTSAHFTSPSGLGPSSKVAGASLSGLNEQSLYLANTFYNIAIPAAQKLTDSLRQQGIPLGHLKTAVADEAKQMIPFVGKNTEARAVIVSLINNALGPGTVSLKSLNKWVGHNSSSLKGFNAIIAQSTIKAGTLANVLETQLNQQFAAATVRESGATQGAVDFKNAIIKTGDASDATRAARQKLITDLENAGLKAKQARDYVNGLQRNIDALHGKKLTISEVGVGKFSITGPTGFRAQGPGGHGGPFLAAGGLVHGPGTPTSDSVLARVSAGEYIVKAAAVAKYGRHMLDAINAKRFADGGFVYSGNAGGLGPATTRFDADFTRALTRAMESAMTSAAAQAAQTFGGGLGKASLRQIENWWIGAGGPGGGTAHVAAAITGAESGFNPRAVQAGQPYATTGWGLWQITPGNSEPQFGVDQALLNPVNNAGAAVAKYRAAGGFSPWTTFEDGAYLRFMDTGGWLPPGWNPPMYNGTGSPELVLNASQVRDLSGRSSPGVEAKLDALIAATRAAPGRTASGMAEALNRTGHRAAYAAGYGG